MYFWNGNWRREPKLTYHKKLDQIKIYAQQLVAEVLSQMRNTEVNSLPVYDKGQFIGRITYEELMSFLNHEENPGSVYAHKLNFDIGTTLRVIKRMNADSSLKVAKPSPLSRQIFIGLSAVAAIALFLMGITWTFFKQDTPSRNAQNKVDAVDKDKVVLTLASGKSIILNEAKAGLTIDGLNLKYSDGSHIAVQEITNSSDSSNYVGRHGNAAVYNKPMILSVPRKGMFSVLLPDGSKVWLNSSSTLKFPATFEGAAKRQVELNGEAYFEIAKVMLKSQRIGEVKRKMPFIVVTDKQEIEVLGTHFNVSAYLDEKNVKTTLVEGSVRIKPFVQSDELLTAVDPSTLDPMQVEGGKKRYGNEVLLKPNQESILTGASLSVKNVDTEEALAWRNGDYIFRNTSLESIMRMLTRWYDVEVVYENKKIGSTLLGGAISKSNKIEEVLKTLELTSNVHFKIEGKRITVVE